MRRALGHGVIRVAAVPMPMLKRRDSLLDRDIHT